jgi:hypothetical protein
MIDISRKSTEIGSIARQIPLATHAPFLSLDDDQATNVVCLSFTGVLLKKTRASFFGRVGFHTNNGWFWTHDGPTWLAWLCCLTHARIAYVLDPEVIVGAVQDAIDELRPAATPGTAKRAAIEADLRRVADQTVRYAAAIDPAPNVDVLVQALQEREDRRRQLKQQRMAVDANQAIALTDATVIEQDLQEQVEQWRAFLLDRQTAIARQMVMRLVEGRIEWTPDREARRLSI